jgi:hypothetical protein
MSALGGKQILRFLADSSIWRAMQRSILALTLVALASAATAATAEPKCVPTLPAWVSPYEKVGLRVLPNTVSLRGYDLRWNGVNVDEKRLAVLLRSAKHLNPLPPLIFKSDYADCAFAHRIERLLKASYPCSGDRCSQVTSR